MLAHFEVPLTWGELFRRTLRETQADNGLGLAAQLSYYNESKGGRMSGNEHSIADVVKSAVRDAQDLLRGEIALAKTELREEARRVGAGAIALVSAAIAGLIAVVFLLTAAAWAISETLAWPVWSGFAIVGAVVLLAAAALALMGRRPFTAQRHMPLTIDTMKETIQWMRPQRP